jgi:16S rRNA (adenine1518-N6/adenine1519-N6)-dimethyltransferase
MNLADRGELVGFLRRHGIDANKGLGQHFLCSQPVVSKIIDAAAHAVSALEVGPGPGVLSQALTRKFEQVTLVELDDRMESLLKESAPQARFVKADALQADLGVLLQELPEPRALVSNLPYYITGPLLERFSNVRAQFSVGVFMMQREVGVRILAKPGNRERGALSVTLQTQFEISKVVDVPPGAFLPPPKVQSIVLAFRPRFVEVPDGFERIVRAGFSQPRKTLANNLMANLRMEKPAVESVLESVEIDSMLRPHELTHDQWVTVAGAAWS